MPRSLSSSLALALFVLGCGAPPSEPTTPAPTSPVSAPAPTPAPDAAAPDEDPPDPAPTFEELLAELETEPPTPWPTLANATRTCPPPPDQTEDGLGEWLEGCDIPAMAAWDARASRWIGLDVDRSEGGIERVSLIAAATTGEETLLTGELSADLVAQLRTMLRRLRVVATPNL